MKIAILKENEEGERRVAISPEVIKKLSNLGFEIFIESNAGKFASFSDDVFEESGAIISKDSVSILKGADIIIKVQPLVSDGNNIDELAHVKNGAILIANLSAFSNRSAIKRYAEAGLTAFALELMPRISRAQSMDILSSQSNLSGYKAVLDAAQEYGRSFPMMMTAAGTIPPAKVFIMGVGVAGLQAIATAKRLGAVVTATDVRPAVKEQVESLGGKFLSIDTIAEKKAETKTGYAKEMSADYKKKQKQIINEHIKKQDIVICTALIPGREAPKLVTEDMVKSMPAGSVIVDLAVESGGNCTISRKGSIISKHGVSIIGHENVPSRMSEVSSTLFAKNVYNFLLPMIDSQTQSIKIDFDDEIVKCTLVAHNGELVHPKMMGEGN